MNDKQVNTTGGEGCMIIIFIAMLFVGTFKHNKQIKSLEDRVTKLEQAEKSK